MKEKQLVSSWLVEVGGSTYGSGLGGLASLLRGELLAGRLASGGLASGLLGAGPLKYNSYQHLFSCWKRKEDLHCRSEYGLERLRLRLLVRREDVVVDGQLGWRETTFYLPLLGCFTKPT